MGWLGWLQDSLAVVWTWLAGFFDWVGQRLKDFWVLLSALLDKFAKWVVSEFVKFKDWAWGEFVSAIEWTSSEIGKFLLLVSQAIWNTFVFISQQLTFVFDLIARKFQEAISFISTELGKLKDSLLLELTKLKETIESKIPDVPLLIGSILVNFQKSMIDGATWFINAVFGVIDPFLLDIAKGIKDGWYEETGIDLEAEP